MKYPWFHMHELEKNRWMQQGLINMMVSIISKCQSLRKMDPTMKGYGERRGQKRYSSVAFNINDMWLASSIMQPATFTAAYLFFRVTLVQTKDAAWISS